MSFSLARLPGESEMKYIYRLGSAKNDGLIDMTWEDLAEIMNRELRDDPSEYYSESAYRKKYALMRQTREEFADSVETVNADELIELRRELEKEKVKVRNERNEYRRLIREEARKESYVEQFTNAIVSAARQTAYEATNVEDNKGGEYDKCDLLIPLFDLHSGIEVDNHWNKYNTDILKNRLDYYLGRIIEIQKRHNAENAYIVCSELLSGIIHPTLRIENNQDLIDQFLTVTAYISRFLIELNNVFQDVYVYVAPGNHSRINPKKDQDIAHENMDNLVIPFLSAKLQNYSRIHCESNVFDQGIAMFAVRGMNVLSVHGDKDSMDNVVEHMRQLFRVGPDLILTGHRHTNALVTKNNIKIVQSGCMSGSDSFSIDHRLYNYPEQMVCVISDKYNLDCMYDVKFKD